MNHLRFTAKMEIIGINPYVLVSKDQAHQLKPDWRRPLPVLVQINSKPDQPWKINMVPVGDGTFYLYLHGDVRKASKTEVGDMVTVDVGFDEEYRNGPLTPLPDWFETALSANDTAVFNWNNLPPSRQKEVVRYLMNLKSQEAKDRNLVRVMQSLSGESTRFMGRDWKDGK
jgi:hypothetical protein